MIFIQITPPPTPPPPPPGLPIDSGIIVLVILAAIYGALIIRKKSNNYHLDFCPICKSKNIKRTNRSFIQKITPFIVKKYS